jgi:hypothetical protein
MDVNTNMAALRVSICERGDFSKIPSAIPDGCKYGHFVENTDKGHAGSLGVLTVYFYTNPGGTPTCPSAGQVEKPVDSSDGF